MEKKIKILEKLLQKIKILEKLLQKIKILEKLLQKKNTGREMKQSMFKLNRTRFQRHF